MIPDSYLVLLSYIIFKLAEGAILYVLSKPDTCEYVYSKSNTDQIQFELSILSCFLFINLLFLSLGHQRHFVGFGFVLVELGVFLNKMIKFKKAEKFIKLAYSISNFLGHKIEFGIVKINSEDARSLIFNYYDHKDNLCAEGIIKSAEVPLVIRNGSPCIKESIRNYFDPVDIIGFDEFLKEAPVN